jgi:MFS family permease
MCAHAMRRARITHSACIGFATSPGTGNCCCSQDGLVLFHYSNASVLPLVSQNLGAENSSDGLLWMSAIMVAPQLIVAAFAPWVGYWAELWGRKPLLLVAFGCEASRALLFATFAAPSWIFMFQLLDGVTGSIMLILTTLVIADLTIGSGRFNLTQGAVAALTGLAAAISTAVTGLIAQQLGDRVGLSGPRLREFDGAGGVVAVFRGDEAGTVRGLVSSRIGDAVFQYCEAANLASNELA